MVGKGRRFCNKPLSPPVSVQDANVTSSDESFGNTDAVSSWETKRASCCDEVVSSAVATSERKNKSSEVSPQQ